MQLPPQPDREKYPTYQTRQCKSFDKLLAWARQYNACFKYEGVVNSEGFPTKDPFEHFHYCPPESPYLPLMTEFFKQRGKGLNLSKAYEIAMGAVEENNF